MQRLDQQPPKTDRCYQTERSLFRLSLVGTLLLISFRDSNSRSIIQGAAGRWMEKQLGIGRERMFDGLNS